MINSLTVAKVFSNKLIFLLQNVNSFSTTKLLRYFSTKNINVFALFEDRNFNVTLANDFVKF